MLGTEYNWLITTSRPDEGAPRVRFASTGLLTLAVAVFCFLCVSLRAEPAHRQLLQEATAAAKAGDTATVLAKLEAARALRPDYPRVRINLARFYVQAARFDDAMQQLRDLAAMGLRMDIERDEAYAPLRNRPGFAELVSAFATNLAPTGRDETAWGIAGMDGIIEGLAVHPATLETFFSDVHNRCIWYRDVSGASAVMKKFSADADGLLGVFALKIDAGRNTLWASSSALPEMKGYTNADKGRAFLAAYNLANRRLAATHPVPPDGRAHVLGDFVCAADGTIYASDSTAPVIWRLTSGAAALEKWLESDEFVSLQGLALSADGRHLHVADYANGLWQVDLATRTPRLLAAPARATFFGIDGLYAVPGGLIAVQNGINPQRIIRIDLAADGTPSAVRVLGAGHPAMSDLALGQVVAGHFDFIGNAGWAEFEGKKGPAPARTVTILRTPLN
ncbi:MAG TPA: tetratricopeptide repeat protein [Lacunisphaera sp.]